MRCLLSIFIFIPFLIFGYDIAIIGDSISFGFGVEQEESYAGILQSSGLTVNNAAVNYGNTSQTDEFISKVFANDSPKILILALGTADTGYYQIPPSLIHCSFEKIIQTALNKETIVLLGQIELGTRFNHLSERYKSQFQEIYKKIHEKYPSIIQFKFMTNDLFLNPLYTLDKTHPNAKGHKIIADILEPIIKNILEINVNEDQNEDQNEGY